MGNFDAEPRRPRRSGPARFLGLLLLAASVGAVIWTVGADEDGWDALVSVGIPAVLALVLLQSVGLLTQAYRYGLTVNEAAQRSLPFLPWLRLFVLGRFLNALAPQAGNAYRGVRLKEEFGIPITKYLSGFLAFVWLSTIVNLVVALGAILVFEPGLELGAIPASLAVTGLLAVAITTPVALRTILTKLHVENSARWGWVYRRTSDMINGTVLVGRSVPTVSRFAAAALAGLAIWVVVFAISFEALSLEASIPTVTLFYVLQQLGTYLSLTPGNLGVQELYSGALASQLGLELADGVLVAALIRITAFITLLAVGFTLGGWRALRQFRRARPVA